MGSGSEAVRWPGRLVTSKGRFRNLPIRSSPQGYFARRAGRSATLRHGSPRSSSSAAPTSMAAIPEIDELLPLQADELDPKKRAAILEKMQRLVYEKAINAPIWELAFLNGVGPRVGESSLGKIPGFPYTAPF